MKKILLSIFCLFGISSAEVDMQKPVHLGELLKISADVMNKNLPTMIDEELRHDKVEAKGKSLIFRYTLIHFTEKEMSADKLKKLMEEDTKKSICRDKDSQMMFKKGIVIVYDYADKNAKHITQFTFDAKACGVNTDLDKLKNILNLVKKKEN